MKPDGLVSARTLREQLKQLEEKARADAPYFPDYMVRWQEHLFAQMRQILEAAEIEQLAALDRHQRTQSASRIDEAPASIRGLRGLIRMPFGYLPSVYFLVADGEVVYIGQAITPAVRIDQHMRTGKAFDSVYLLPTPDPLLNAVEGALIRHFHPRLNSGLAPGSPLDDKEILEHVFRGGR